MSETVKHDLYLPVVTQKFKDSVRSLYMHSFNWLTFYRDNSEDVSLNLAWFYFVLAVTK